METPFSVAALTVNCIKEAKAASNTGFYIDTFHIDSNGQCRTLRTGGGLFVSS